MPATPGESTAPTISVPDMKALDRVLALVVLLAFVILFLSPTRTFFIPFSTGGEYQTFIPPNVMDLLWLGVGGALFVRSGVVSGRTILALSLLLAVGAAGLWINGEAGNNQIGDLLLFNLRTAGALALGSMLWRSGFTGETLALTYLGGAGALAASSLVLALGGVSYDFYTELRRFGSLGISPNETSTIFAGAFSMLPWLARERRWPVLVAPLLYLGVLLTGSRTGLLLMMAGFAAWVPTIRGSVRSARGVVAWALIVLAAAAVTWWVNGLFQQLVNQGALANVSQRTFEDESTTFRVTIYLDTLAYLWEHPSALLIGVGGSNVAVEWALVRLVPLGTLHTHDMGLQALLAYGVIGPAVCAVLLLPLLRRPVRFPDRGTSALRAFLLCIVAGQVIQYGLYEEKFQLLFFIALGYVAAASAQRTEKPVDTTPTS